MQPTKEPTRPRYKDQRARRRLLFGRCTIWAVTALILPGIRLLSGEDCLGPVDFRYTPPEWQTAICLPDDPHKTLVDRSGELLYHYRQGNREFGTRIGVEVSTEVRWRKQELVSPRVPIVRTVRAADDLEIVEEAFAATELPSARRWSAESPRRNDGNVNRDAAGPPRNDLILVRVWNRGKEPRTIAPRLIVDTRLDFHFAPGAQRVVVNEQETITASLPMTGLADAARPRRLIQLEPLTIAAGRRAEFFVLHCGGGSIAVEPTTLSRARACRRRAVAWWEKGPLPFGRVEVPDAGIQALVDSSIRNIWQAREIKSGLPVFQVGPTCYRGLWIVDGAFLLEAATMIGAGKEARSGITYMLQQQKPSGAFEVLSPHYFKENGIVLWACARHALLTQDPAWLESVWLQLERAAGHILTLRRRSLENDTALDDGLHPPGEIDGGLSGLATGFNRAEFSNTHWNLVGLRALVEAARWLGKAEAAARWQREYDDFYAAFRRAAARDVQLDPHGHSYVPICMANAGSELPQRAQWTFCHATYPGQIFERNDPLVASTLAMLEATEREGMVYGTGWDATGLWTYFASFYGHAWLWQGKGRKSAQALYAYANHAAPTLVWREEQSLHGAPFRKVGDMPHNWASAEFIRWVIHLLALDRGTELHLLEGFPSEWAGPGMVTRLKGIATPFGPLDLAVRADRKGRMVTVEVEPLAANCSAVIVHRPDGSTVTLDPQRGGRLSWTVAGR